MKCAPVSHVERGVVDAPASAVVICGVTGKQHCKDCGSLFANISNCRNCSKLLLGKTESLKENSRDGLMNLCQLTRQLSLS